MVSHVQTLMSVKVIMVYFAVQLASSLKNQVLIFIRLQSILTVNFYF